MKSNNFTLTSLLIFTLVVPFGPAIEFANAELAAPSTTGTNVPWPTEQTYCDSVCPSIADTKGKVLGLGESEGWSASDDQWCANHNSQTSPSVMAAPMPMGSTVPTESCAAPFYPGDTTCADTTSKLAHCAAHNGQLENYCMAYQGAKQGIGGEKAVLVLDIAATAVCTAACVMEMNPELPPGSSTTAMRACDGAAIGAGAAEILVTLTQKASTLGKLVDGTLAAAGIAEGISGLTSQKGLLSVTPLKQPSAASTVNKKPMSQDQRKNEKNACVTALGLAALTGVRYYNMGWGERTQKSSCGNIFGLASNAAVLAATGGLATAGSVSGTSASTAGGTTSASGATSGDSSLRCLSTGGTITSCTSPGLSAATDGGLLNSGLLNAVAPAAQQLANQGLGNALNSGGLGAAMGGALAGSGDLGSAMTKIAEQALKDGAALSQVASMGTGGGGGGGGGSHVADDSPGLGAMFPPAGGAAAAGGPLQVFKGDPNSTDIWHAHSDQNLFQIVSGKIEKVIPRIAN